jgi:hypothetical protein
MRKNRFGSNKNFRMKHTDGKKASIAKFSGQETEIRRGSASVAGGNPASEVVYGPYGATTAPSHGHQEYSDDWWEGSPTRPELKDYSGRSAEGQWVRDLGRYRRERQMWKQDKKERLKQEMIDSPEYQAELEAYRASGRKQDPWWKFW